MWFGTNGGGMARFDGQEFEAYTSRDGLLDNSCYTFLEDTNHTFWIGTNDGVSTFQLNGQKPIFKHYKGPNNELDHVWIRNIMLDSKGNIWFTTNFGIFQKTENELIQFDDDNGLISNSIRAICEDKDGNIWIGYDPGGIAKISNGKITNFGADEGFANDFVFDIEIDQYGSLWLACANDGLYHFDREKFTHVVDASEEISAEMRDIAIDQDGVIWFGSMEGIAKISNYSGDINECKVQSLTVNSNLQSNIIWNIFIDKDNNKWLGTYGGGVARIERENYTLFDKSVGMIDDFMWSVMCDNKGRIWAGSIDQGLSIISSDNIEQQYVVKHTLTTNNGLLNNGVQAFYQDSMGRVWIGTSNGLMICSLRADGSIKTHGCLSDSDILMGKSVRCLYKGNNDQLFVGASDGLYKIIPNKNGLFKSEFVTSKLKGYIVYSIAEDLENQLWIATGSGLFNIEKNGAVKEFTTNEGLSNSDVRTVIADDFGKIWMATGAGLCIYDSGTKEFKTIGYNDGLSSGRLYFIYLDYKQDMWIGSGTGIDMFDFLKYQRTKEIDIDHLGKNDGFAEFETNTNVITEDEKGNIWIGTINGLIRYNSREVIQKIIDPPKPMITRFKVFDNDRSTNEKTILNYDENYITIKYVGLHYQNPDEVYYRYVLKGRGERWSPVTKEKTAIFSDLAPGEYTFILSAGIKDASIEEQQTSFSFVIKAAIWQTIWFKVSLGALISLIVLGVFRMRTKNLKQRQIVLAREVERKTKEVVIERDEARKQKDEASAQRKIAELKKTEILDSINYAKRIQTAILPPLPDFVSAFSDCFVFYQPKDIVAGDFYWMERLEDVVLFAAADCTGHGVPGAMVSVVCNNALNRAVREFKLRKPAEILDKVTELVLEAFEKSIEDVKDGMDIALCRLDLKNNTLQYAGANNPLWIARDEEIIATKANKQCIGYNDYFQPFTNHEIDLLSGDTIFVFTDGYIDQFGGEKGKKFKSRPFKKLLLSIQDKVLDDQRKELTKHFSKWKRELEQVDDICVIGVCV